MHINAAIALSELSASQGWVARADIGVQTDMETRRRGVSPGLALTTAGTQTRKRKVSSQVN